MKAVSTAASSVGELVAVLDASTSERHNGHATPLDDEAIENLADQQDVSRKCFDEILARSSQEWLQESDCSVLSKALVAVLDQLRGPALARIGLNQSTNIIQRTESNMQSDSNLNVTMKEFDWLQSASNEYLLHAQVSPSLKIAAIDAGANSSCIAKRARYIPLRLSQSERKILRLVEAALSVSEYTDVVDVLSSSRMKTKQRIHAQIRDLCSILTGLAVAMDYSWGQNLVKNKDFANNEAFFQTAFEIARRHKVANPEKCRDTYGKLIHMLQDSGTDEIRPLLEFSCVKPLVTVYSYLEQRGGIEMLDDPLLAVATREIIPKGKSRMTIEREIEQKERAIGTLAKRYKNGRVLDEEEVRRCLYSLGDNNAYLRGARDPCDAMIGYLQQYFKAEPPLDRKSSLAIQDGSCGARLTHDHVRQFRYVFQSLALWREICHDMYRLWCLSEKDLLDSGNWYHLRNTGQGLNRVQAAPTLSRAMHGILNTVQQRVGSWVGSSVVHLGDYNVPNALTFIDKYAQVQRILGPLVTCIARIAEVAIEDVRVEKYVTETFGGVETARKMILRDFFRHAFDGSGASDWFSAGSCIDGRLTSAWNWCSEIERKPYWSLFLLVGFTGFDGDF